MHCVFKEILLFHLTEKDLAQIASCFLNWSRGFCFLFFKLFHILDLVIIAFVTSLVTKIVWLTLIYFLLRRACLSYNVIIFQVIEIVTAQKWSFPLKISSVNVTKSAGNCWFGHFNEDVLNGKLHFLSSACCDNVLSSSLLNESLQKFCIFDRIQLQVFA